MNKFFVALSVVVFSIFFAGCGTDPQHRDTKTFKVTVDQSVAPKTPTIDDPSGSPRPVAASVDSSGIQTDFVENEIILVPNGATEAERQGELNDFLARYNGRVVGDSNPPAPPAGLDTHGAAPLPGPVHYLIRLKAPLKTATSGAMSAPGAFGNLRVSSPAAAGLVSAIANEINEGHNVSANHLAYGASVPTMTHLMAEYPGSMPGTWLDSLTLKVYNNKNVPSGLSANGNGATVAGAWQLLNFIGKANPASVSLAVLDGGFYLDSSGAEIVSPGSIGSDLPAHPLQWNVSANTPIASGSNESKCTNGNPCPWHGNGSVGVAAGLTNNKAGYAGTGGLVANPILLKEDLSDDKTVSALRLAALWGAQIINMSFGGSCNDFCRAGRTAGDYYSTFSQLNANGVIIVASAGNDGVDSTANKFQPCEGVDGVICVGALADWSNTRASYSNWGASVNIWAPSNIPVMDDGNSGPMATPFGANSHGGTSASAPYVAGVIALMKAVNPGLNAQQTKDLLQQSAWSDSSDPAVHDNGGYLNALGAVLAAMGGLPPDPFEPNNTPAQASPIISGQTYFANLTNSADVDYYKFTLTDYSDVVILIDSMPEGLEGIDVFEVKPLDAANQYFPVSETYTKSGTTYTYSGKTLAPGTYQVFVGSPKAGIHPYQITLTSTRASLSPDSFEYNNDRNFAASLPSGAYPANHHNLIDDDYYLIYASGTLGGRLEQKIGVRHANVPQQVTLLDSLGNVRSMQTGTDVTFTFGGADGGNFFYLKVSAPISRYEIFNEMTFDLSGFPQVGGLVGSSTPYFLNPVDPSPFGNVMTGSEAWFIMSESPVNDSGRGSKITLAGERLQMELYDPSGNKLVEGVYAGTSTDPFGSQTMSILGILSQNNVPYALHVTRLDYSVRQADGTLKALPHPPALPDGTIPAFPVVPFTVTVKP